MPDIGRRPRHRVLSLGEGRLTKELPARLMGAFRGSGGYGNGEPARLPEEFEQITGRDQARRLVAAAGRLVLRGRAFFRHGQGTERWLGIVHVGAQWMAP